MEKIASFTIDHNLLQPGVYVSRKDQVAGGTVTTFDLRMTSPNEEPVMNTAEMHTIEHLGATFLRNHKEFGDKTVYFGPMGCRTGFYLLLAGDYSSRDILPLMVEMYEFIRDFEGEVPGASPKDCGDVYKRQQYSPFGCRWNPPGFCSVRAGGDQRGPEELRRGTDRQADPDVS